MEGWIKLHRDITKWEWYSDDKMFKFFTYLLLRANYEEGNWKGIKVGKGSFITSYKILAKDVGYSIQQVRTMIDRLISTQEITRNSTRKYIVLTICNYAKYQSDEENNNTNSNTNNNTKITPNQHQNNTKITTNKNIKNNKEDNNYITHTSRTHVHTYTRTHEGEDFENSSESENAENIELIETEEIPFQKSCDKKVFPSEDEFINNLYKFRNQYLNTKRFEELCMAYKRNPTELRDLLDEFIKENKQSREHATKADYTFFYQSLDKHFFYWLKSKINKQTPKQTNFQILADKVLSSTNINGF